MNNSLIFYFWLDSSINFSYKWWYFLWKGWMSRSLFNVFWMNFLKVGKSLIFYLIAYSSIFLNYLNSRFKFLLFSSVLFSSNIFRWLNLLTMFPIIIKFGVWYLLSVNFYFMSLITCESSSKLLLSLFRYAFLKTSYSIYRKFPM